MKLHRAIIKNFRSIKYASISFEPTCRVLIGINEAGKSNVLRALSLLDPASKVVSDDVREVAPTEDPAEEALVMFEFSLDCGERLAAYQRFRTLVLADDKSPIVTNYAMRRDGRSPKCRSRGDFGLGTV